MTYLEAIEHIYVAVGIEPDEEYLEKPIDEIFLERRIKILGVFLAYLNKDTFNKLLSAHHTMPLLNFSKQIHGLFPHSKTESS